MKAEKCNCLIFRTNTYSERWHEKLLSLTDRMKIIVVADQRKSILPYTGLELINFNRDSVESIGLNYDDEVQWRCGDYAFYLALERFNFNYALMIEPDCIFNNDSLIKLINIESNADFCSTYLSRADDNWYWKSVSCYGEETYRCFFPVTRVSYSTAKQLYSSRKRLGSAMNDESFVASDIMHRRGKILDINELADIRFDRGCYSYRNVHYYPLLIILIKLNLFKKDLFHPVYFDFLSYLKAFIRKRTWKIFLKMEVKD